MVGFDDASGVSIDERDGGEGRTRRVWSLSGECCPRWPFYLGQEGVQLGVVGLCYLGWRALMDLVLEF